jgi:hypothetical protein
MTGDLALAVRDGLPDPLRLLVARYPRIGWEAHPHFTELTRFWLERHLGFRRMQARLVTDTRGFLDRDRDPEAYARGLYRVASQLFEELHGHHMIEDQHYFPILQRLDPRVAHGFDLLETDHHALDAAIQGLADAANTIFAAVRDATPGDAAAGVLDGRLAEFGRLLDRHLVDEEELVVPVILDHPEAGL